MLTCIGKYLRKLRLDHGETLKVMAEKLEVSSAFLSAVENGKKKMPRRWFSKLEALYSLNQKQINDLKSAVLDSGDTIELTVRDVSPENRRLAVFFARQFETLDKETAQTIMDILNKNTED